MASAVLIDATIVRGILLPAAMTLLGDSNWYLPRQLAWIPGPRPEEAAPTAVAGGPTDPEPALTRTPA